jgi:hypothetical protein
MHVITVQRVNIVKNVYAIDALRKQIARDMMNAYLMIRVNGYGDYNGT